MINGAPHPKASSDKDKKILTYTEAQLAKTHVDIIDGAGRILLTKFGITLPKPELLTTLAHKAYTQNPPQALPCNKKFNLNPQGAP